MIMSSLRHLRETDIDPMLQALATTRQPLFRLSGGPPESRRAFIDQLFGQSPVLRVADVGSARVVLSLRDISMRDRYAYIGIAVVGCADDLAPPVRDFLCEVAFAWDLRKIYLEALSECPPSLASVFAEEGRLEDWHVDEQHGSADLVILSTDLAHYRPDGGGT